jgi:peptidoglycan hydrolase-like protein with peptidoglycan-binding domain
VRRSIVAATAVAASLLVLPTPVEAAPAATSTPQSDLVGLKIGSRGSAVTTLQKMLQSTGLYLPGGADGIFGAGTQAALQMFQGWNGLDRSGVVTKGTAFWLQKAAGGAPSSAGSNSGGSTTKSGVTSGSSSSSWKGLKQGARGSTAKAMQAALMAAGVPLVGGADGIFGPATHSAVAAFQGWNGLAVTGVVNEATEKALRAAATTTDSPKTTSSSSGGSGASTRHVGLKQGSRGDLVKDLQRALMQSGLALFGGADGVFGPATTSTLKVFQKVNGLTQSGVLSSQGAKYLGLGSSTAGVTATVGFAQFGESGSRVVALQKALLATGIWFPGGADGAFGGSTAGAVMEFQRREGLAVTGKIDSITASRLKLNAASAPSAPSAASVKMKVFPVQGKCWFADTWLAPRGTGRTHQGTDVIAAEGKLLYAVVDGTVSKVYSDYPGSRAGNGLRVQQGDGTYFTYLHLSELAKGIGVGSKVKAGDVIGFVGNTGNSATPHLHFEVHPNGGAAINPYPLLKAMNDCSNTSAQR